MPRVRTGAIGLVFGLPECLCGRGSDPISLGPPIQILEWPGDPSAQPPYGIPELVDLGAQIAFHLQHILWNLRASFSAFSKFVQCGEQARAKAVWAQKGLRLVLRKKPQCLPLPGLTSLVDFRSLLGMLSEAAEGFPGVGKAAFLQQVKPHLQIHNLLVTQIKTPGSVTPPKEHGGGFANQITVLLQATGNHLGAVVHAGLVKILPSLQHLRVLAHHIPRGGRQGNGGIGFQQVKQLDRKSVV